MLTALVQRNDANMLLNEVKHRDVGRDSPKMRSAGKSERKADRKNKQRQEHEALAVGASSNGVEVGAVNGCVDVADVDRNDNN